MADYASSEVTIQYGASSSLQDPDINKVLSTALITPVEFMQRRLVVSSGASTISLASFTSIKQFFVQNNGTDTVTLVFQTNVASATYSMDIDAGEWIKLTDIDPTISISLSAATVDCSCDIIAIGT